MILKGTHRRDTGWQLGSPSSFFYGFGIAIISALLPIFELAHAGSEEIAKLRFERRPSAEYKLQEDGNKTRRLSLASGA